MPTLPETLNSFLLKSDLSAWSRGSFMTAFADGSRWMYSGAGTANGGTVINAAGGGVWVRELTTPEVRPEWFKLSTDSDDTNSLQRALDTGLPVRLGVNTYNVSSTLSVRYGQRILGVSPNDAAFNTLGHFNSRIQFYNLPDNGFAIICSADTSTQALASAMGNPLQDIDIVGKGTTSGQIGVLVQGYLQTPIRCKIHGFNIGLRTDGPHAFDLTFRDLHLTGNHIAYSVGSNVADSGEKVAFENCVLNNNDYHIVFYGLAYVTLYNTSLDYANTAVVLLGYTPQALDQCGTLMIFGGHVENDPNNPKRFLEAIQPTGGQNYWPAVVLTGTKLFKAVDQSAFWLPSSWIGSNVGWSSIKLESCVDQGNDYINGVVSRWPEVNNYPSSGEIVQNVAGAARKYTLLYPFTLTPTATTEAYVNVNIGRTSTSLALAGQFRLPPNAPSQSIIVHVPLPSGWCFKLDYSNASLSGLGTRIAE